MLDFVKAKSWMALCLLVPISAQNLTLINSCRNTRRQLVHTPVVSELLFIRKCLYYICYKYHIFYIIFLYRFPFAPCHQDKILIRVQAWQKTWSCFRWVEEGCKAVYIGSLVTVLTHIAFQSIEHLKYRITNQTQGIGAKWKWRHLEQHTCFLSHVGMPFRWERCYELHT